MNEISMQNFKHKTPVQIRFKDVDMMGHVNNANFLTYVEDARLKYFEDVTGKDSDWSHQKGLILGRIEINYKLPMHYKDIISVYSKCSRIGNKSFDLSWIIARESKLNEENEILAYGVAVLVCYNYEQKKSMEISHERKQQIEKYEGIQVS